FDGDQMAVHLPLSIEAQVEAHTLMMSTHNIFSPSNGAPIISPSQDTVMGCYYLTMNVPDSKGDGMAFASPEEVETAYSAGTLSTHAKIKLRLPEDRCLREDLDSKSGYGKRIDTTVGRVMFNRILPKGMPYYNTSLRGRDLASVISDCYELMGRRYTIDLLDDMNQLGFRQSTLSGLSFATDDLVTPDTKGKILAEAEKEVIKTNKHYQRGIITENERYNKVLDAWTHAREQITAEMMTGLESDFRTDGYVNPIYLMAHSGARGGIEQMRQLGGMRGLMAKPSGKIIETPIKANFREGLTVLEYFSSTHGARKGLADTALKTADSGYLTRKLADVAQNVVITQHDCGTTQGITKGIIYRGEKVEVSLAESIRGRVSRANIVNPITDEVIVAENEMITGEIARKIEQLGLEKIQVRSPMTCDASLGVCRCCYGMDLSTGSLVEEGMAVGIIAAQSIGEPGTQLTMRTFHIGGVAQGDVEKSDIRAKKGGIAKLARLKVVTNDAGQQVVLTRNGEIALVDEKGREVEKYDVPAGAVLSVKEDGVIKGGEVICEWDPHSIPILAETGGRIRFEDLVDGETMRGEADPSGKRRYVIMEHKGDLHPQIVVEDPDDGKIIDFYYMPERAHIEVDDGQMITPGSLLAKTPREASGTQDITGGLPRVTEIFEARKPKDPAVIAEIDGVVELLGEKKRGKRSIIVRSEAGIEREHLVSHSKHLRVHAGDMVRAGESLVDGPLVPHDILRISGEEAVQQYLTREIQNVYRSQRVEINDKHIEIIVSSMLRKVKIESPGDTDLLPGSVMDKFDFRSANENVSQCLKISHKGDSDFEEGAIVPKDVLEQTNAQIEALGGDIAKGTKPKMATASTQLLGITKASVQSSSFISAASFQETTKVLTEAALSGKTDYLVGLKENVILGHLIPAGTGFKSIQDSEVRIQPSALEALAAEKERVLERSFPLLESALQAQGDSEPASSGNGQQASAAEQETPGSLDALLGGDGGSEPSSDPPQPGGE
ncbi:MAG: DNA-directed RNA polymerase subunit beta', partial [Planctomycetales bacterium]|nr:DNA-directed RNA polymerase subunit beta' [Planctomycetales bacterium]